MRTFTPNLCRSKPRIGAVIFVPPRLSPFTVTKTALYTNLYIHTVGLLGDVVPILREGELDIISYNAEQTQRLGTRLGTLLEPGDIICLSGDMGAGKTVFSAGIGKGWGALTPLTSPTFNIVHEHRRSRDSQHLYHMDCYRLQSPTDAEAVGLEEILNGNGPAIIEWPEKIEPVLPRQRLWVELRILEPTRRNFIFEAAGKRYEQLLEKFRGISFGV